MAKFVQQELFRPGGEFWQLVVGDNGPEQRETDGAVDHGNSEQNDNMEGEN